MCGACRLLLPTVVFCFSKKRVDALADNLSRLDLSTASEKSEVLVLTALSAVATLQPLRLSTLDGCGRSLTPSILDARQQCEHMVHHCTVPK